jgi:MFS family permease
MIGLGIIWPLVPLLAVEFGASGIQVGIVIASFNIARSLSNPLAGRLSDRMGRKTFILVGLLLYALVSTLYVAAGSVETLIGIRLLHGFASVLVAPVAMALVADIAPTSQLGLFMGTMSMATMLGIGIGPMIGGIIKDLFGMDTSFFTMGGLVFATMAGVATFIPGNLGKRAIPKEDRRILSTRDLFGNRTFQMLFLLRFFAASGQGAVYTFLPLLAVRMALSSSQVGIVLGVNILLIAVLQRRFGKMADLHNPALLMIGGTVASGLTVLGMPFAGGFGLVLFLNCTMGIANGIAMPGGYVLAGRLGREHGMGSVMGFTDSAWSLGMVVSPVLSGLILDVLGMESVFYLGGALILAGSLIAALLYRAKNK